MASSSNLLGKRKPEDDFETKPVLKKHKDNETTTSDEVKDTEEVLDDLVEDDDAVRTKMLFVTTLSCQTQISDIIDFFKDVGEVVRVRLIVDFKGKKLGQGFVEFASVDQAKKALQKKKGDYLHKSKIFLEVADKEESYLAPTKYCIDHTVWHEEDYFQIESLPVQEDETPRNLVEEVLLVANLSPQVTKIVEIINFFKGVGKVVGVRLIVNHECKHVGYCFVEFGSSNQSEKALKKKNGAYLYDHPILLMKGIDETPDLVEASSVRNKTLFIANLSRQTEISEIIDFFKDVGEVVHVRLTVDHKGKHGKHVGHGFVEFASANEAMKALANKNGEYLNNRKIDLIVFKTAPNPKLPKYCIDHKVWYNEDAATVEGFDETPEEVEVRKKTLFFVNHSHNNRIDDITTFINHAGEIVRARLIVDRFGEDVGCGFLEFASANIAMDVMVKKTGAKFYLNLAEKARYPFRPKIAEKLWYEDNLLRESLDYKIKRTLKKRELKKQALDLKQRNMKKHGNRIEYCGLGITRVPFRGKKIIFSDEE